MPGQALLGSGPLPLQAGNGAGGGGGKMIASGFVLMHVLVLQFNI